MIVLDRTRLIAGSDFLDSPVNTSKNNKLHKKLSAFVASCAQAAQFRVLTAECGARSAFADSILRISRGSVHKRMIFLAPSLP